MAKHKTTSQLIAEAQRGSNNGSGSKSKKISWIEAVDYWTDEEKFFKGIVLSVSRKEHKRPSEIEQDWSLPDLVLVYSSYIEEAQELEEMNSEMESMS